jgi:hypothetical protein
VVLNTISGIEDLALQKNLSIYPNPATDFIQINANETPIKIELVNLLGAVIRSYENLNLQNYIELRDVSENVLLVRVHFKDGMALGKVVVQ